MLQREFSRLKCWLLFPVLYCPLMENTTRKYERRRKKKGKRRRRSDTQTEQQRGGKTQSIINCELNAVNANTESILKWNIIALMKRAGIVISRCIYFWCVSCNKRGGGGLYRARRLHSRCIIRREQTMRSKWRQNKCSTTKLCSGKIQSLYHWMLNKAFAWQEIKKPTRGTKTNSASEKNNNNNARDIFLRE